MSEILSGITRYLAAVYRDGARGENGEYDCWGLVRSARVELYGRKLLPICGGEYRYDPEGFTEHYKTQSRNMATVKEPQPGTIIASLKKSGRCVHVALVVHDINRTGMGLHVLDINPGKNARMIPLFRYLELNSHRVIKFHDDKSISQSA